MSTSRINRLNAAPLSNFYKVSVTRLIYIQKDLWVNNIEREACRYSEEFNRIIQKLNVNSKSLLIPYYRVIPKRANNDSEFNRAVCGYLRFRKKGKGSNKSLYVPDSKYVGIRNEHVIDLLICSDYKMITASNQFCFKALGDINTLRRIMTDTLLDEAICYSYFGMDALTDEDLSYINKCKLKFIKENKLTSAYRIDEDDIDRIPALSFASFCRKGNEIKARKYINLWESFICSYFKGQIPVIPSVDEQLKLHEQYEQLPYRLAEDIKALPEGAYLVLRINREPKESNKEIIEAIFGLDASIGRIKIVPIHKFFIEEYQLLIQDLVISAYKVINKKA